VFSSVEKNDLHTCISTTVHKGNKSLAAFTFNSKKFGQKGVLYIGKMVCGKLLGKISNLNFETLTNFLKII